MVGTSRPALTQRSQNGFMETFYRYNVIGEETNLGILDTAKDVITLVQKADNLELVKQVLALQKDIMSMMDENHELKDQIRKLKDQSDTKQALTVRGNQYWLKKEDGTEDGPFCTACQDSDSKLIRLSEGAGRGYFFCQVCELKAVRG
jgi:hypothetical protein